MILRALALCLLTALPVAAQDFRGLRPGMDASALGSIGEPLEFFSDAEGVQAIYPLPFSQRLMVSYSQGGTIGLLATYAEPNAPEAPDNGGLRLGATTLRAFARQARLRADDLAAPGLVSVEPFSETRFSLVYDLPEAADAVLLLDFNADPEADRAVAPDRRLIELGRSVLSAVTFVLRDDLEPLRHPDTFPDGPRTAPIPFPLSIDEAFPSLIP